MAYTGINKSTEHFNTKLYTGTGSTQSITGLDFQPDFTWIKSRSDGLSHALFDSIRGVTKVLNSNATTAEYTNTDTLTAFESDGFSVGSNTGVNANGETRASWNWKAGTSFTNDASATGIGTIDSTGSINTDAGFSIISYSGNSTSGATVGHGLGVTPSMIIVKRRTAGEQWEVYHKTLGATKRMALDTTGASSASSSRWNNTEPTTSVFSLGNSGATNTSGSTYIAYCFADVQGYSKFGSYTGNGNADGTFVYTGFSPAFVIFKRSSGTGNWQLLDNKRLGYNVENRTIYPNSTLAEQDENDADLLSNGFKLRGSGTDGNGSGSTYIYMAFASEPFTTSTTNGSIPVTAR